MQRATRFKAMKIGQVTLSAKEVGTLYFFVRGMTAKEIAAQLYVSRRTIEHRLSMIKREFGFSRRSQLIGALLDLGFSAIIKNQ